MCGENINMRNERYYEELDGLKGIVAVIIAYFYHYSNEFNGAQPNVDIPIIGNVFAMMYEYGYLLVEIFFCISGFVMFKGYYSNIVNDRISIGQYVYKRIVRLFPLLWMTTIVAFIFQWFNNITIGESYMNTYNDVFNLILALLGMQSGWCSSATTFNSPAWFISVILVCYIIFYVTSRKTKTNAPLWWMGLILLGIYIVRINPFERKVPLLWDTMGRGYISFFLGVLIAYIATRYAGNKQIKRLAITASIVGITVWGIGYLFDLLGSKLLTFALIISPAIVILCINIVWIRKVLACRVCRFLGKISFSVYLWNFPTDMFFDIFNRYTNWFDYESTMFYVLHLGISLLIAVVSYKWMEPNAERMFKKFLAVLDWNG